jgi:hypothetical protein
MPAGQRKRSGYAPPPGAVQTPAAGAITPTEELTVTALVIVCVILAIVIYGAIVAWPQRIPSDRTVAAIRRRIDDEDKRR